MAVNMPCPVGADSVRPRIASEHIEMAIMLCRRRSGCTTRLASFANASRPVHASTTAGMMFVLSTQRLHNMAFFIMNQATLDRGPAVGYPDGGPNTWACANSGEWDILESSWSQPGPVSASYLGIACFFASLRLKMCRVTVCW